MKKEDFVVNERPGYLKISLANFKNPNPGRQVKYQAIPLKDSFVEEILTYVNTLEDGALLFPSKKYVFGWGWKTIQNKSMSTRTALRRLRHYNLGHLGQDEKFHKIWLHWFRHQRLGELAKQGIPDRQLAQISGHASTEMLDIYIHLNPYSIPVQPG